MAHRTVFATDNHGYLDELIAVLAEAGLTDDDGNWIAGDDASLIYLGDWADRGPKSVELYRYLRGLQDQLGRSRVKILMGNHDMQYAISMMTCFGDSPEEKAEFNLIHTALAINIREDVRAGNLTFACVFKDPDTGEDWLCTHGGLDPRWERLNKMSSVRAAEELNRLGRECVLQGAHHLEIMGVDEYRRSAEQVQRGIFDPIPGITWTDVEDNLRAREDQLGHNLIVGHRQQQYVNLSAGGKIWAINVDYGHAQLLVHDIGKGFRPGVHYTGQELIDIHGQAEMLPRRPQLNSVDAAAASPPPSVDSGPPYEH